MPRVREWIQRVWGSVRRARTDADLEQELRLHVELAAEDARRREGIGDPGRTARVRVGGIPQALDALRDQRGVPWLEALAADLVVGWRQLTKHRVATLSAILSLGLAIGATTAAFRLVDALLLRPLPVADPERLFVVATTFVDTDNRPDYRDDFDFPTYREFAKTLAGSAELMVVGAAFRNPVRFGSDSESETAVRQFVSGSVFPSFGLQPAAGRLFTRDDDGTPGAHPVAVVSHHYWTRRFGRDPAAVGKTVNVGNQPFEIIGVAPEGFTGTEPGSLTDIFIPALMNVEALNRPGWSWFRIWVRPRDGVSAEQVREMLQARFRADHEARLKNFPTNTPKERIDAYLREEVRLLAAGSGVSGTQKTFRRPLVILAALAALVLLIACANVANLLIARAIARQREMALRVSIGATRRRLIQLVLTESALLAIIASGVGVLFASWAAPLVVSMLSPVGRPVQLVLEADWRTVRFSVVTALTVTILFGLVPALRASSAKPLAALKGGEDPRAQRRLTNVVIGVQTAFCVFLLFAAALFIGTFERLVNQRLGFTHENVLLLPVETGAEESPEIWRQIGERVSKTVGVESAAVAGWAPLSGNRWRASVHVEGHRDEPNSPYFVEISVGYFRTMRIAMVDGRDFRSGDTGPRTDERELPRDGVGIVNEAFARVYFSGNNPVGKRVQVRQNKNLDSPMQIVGVVRDAAYDNVREPMRPTVYVPLDSRSGATLLVRTAGDSSGLAAGIRRDVLAARPDMRVRATEPLSAFVRQQMMRERLLATLSAFFASLALLLAAIGLYGVLNYAVMGQRREIGIRMALGAGASQVVRHVALVTFTIVCAGTLAGVAGGLVFGRVVDSLLFQVKPSDPQMLVGPILALVVAGGLAALPPAMRAVRIDPAQTLRSE